MKDSAMFIYDADATELVDCLLGNARERDDDLIPHRAVLPLIIFPFLGRDKQRPRPFHMALHPRVREML
jgi:hypothetical protein